MEPSKAIKIIKINIQHYALIQRLRSIGLDPDLHLVDHVEMYSVIFDHEVDDHNELGEIFHGLSDKLIDSHDFQLEIKDKDLTSTAIDIYSDWRAYYQKQITIA